MNRYTLEERTAVFAENTITLLKKIKISTFNMRLIDQCIGSAGSIGANYSEANEAESRLDFIHKIGICKKETKETKHWLRLLAFSHIEYKKEFDLLSKECQELLLIFSAINRTSRKKV